MIVDYIQGSALLLALCWLQTVNSRVCASRGGLQQWCSGLLFGGTCIIGMLTPIALEPGLIFDARTVVLSMAGLFGGPLVALLAGLLAGGYRLWLGGTGVWVGLANVITPLLLGLLYRHYQRQGKLGLGAWPLLAFGLLVSVVEVGLLNLLPAAQASLSLGLLALPMLTVLPLATLLLGLLLKDIRQREGTESALRIGEARLRAITGAIPDLFLVFDEEGRYLEVIAPEPRLLPCASADLIGRRVHEVLPGVEGERCLAFIQRTLASEGPQLLEYRVQTLAGPKVFEGRAQRIEGLLAGQRAVVWLARDVSERISVELERRIAAIAFESQQGMLITDSNNIILRVNQAFSAITGYSAAEVLGQHTRMLSSGRQSPAFYQAMWRSIHDNSAWQGEIWNRRKNGDVFPEWLSISAVRDAQGQVCNYVASLTDTSEHKAAEVQIKHLAFFDPLTELPNRRLLLDRLQHAQAASVRSGQFAALMFLDLDNFKNINDLYGHQIGDKLLCLVAERLTGCVRSCDTVARLGGDEFVVLLESLKPPPAEAATQAEQIGKKILQALAELYRIDTLELRSSASIGLLLFNDEQYDIHELMKRADLSMYEAKTAGKNALRFFDPAMQEAVSARLQLEEEIRQGLQAGEFIMYLQPQMHQQYGLVGAEALARWQHPQRGLLSPAAFIEVAERTGLIDELDFQMLQQACQQLASWAQQPQTAALHLAVNLSARLLYQDDFVERLLQLLAASGANPECLKLELTETLLLDDLPGAVVRMTALKAHGIRFSIDDFGTGYSSMVYLQQLPLDQLKIDQSFVRALPGDDSSLAIIRAICSLAASLNLEVIAEGVETQAQRELLLATGCRRFQGYLFGRPMPLAEFARLPGCAAEVGALNHQAVLSRQTSRSSSVDC
jgi:diguanylate cyclase (GGDEF)-like protein/PAS domain S-box-containing protein